MAAGALSAASVFAVGLLLLAAAGCRDTAGGRSGSASQSDSGAGTWITLLHTNDIHGEYQARPIERKESTGEGGKEEAPLAGGFLALAGTVTGIREAATDPILLFDAGDLMAGTPLTAIVRQGARGGGAMEFMNAVGYDAMALGNHEFDLGRENCLRLIALAKFPVLSANLVERETGKVFTPAGHAIFERNNVRIAVIGLILDALPMVVAKEPIAALEVRRGIDVARAEVADLDPASDLIVVLAHQGLDACRALARAVPEIDIIIAGHDHDHTKVPIVESGVLIVEAGSRLEWLGRLDVRVAGDRVVDHRYQLLELPAAAAEAAPSPVVALYDEIEAAIEADYGQVVGHLAIPFVRSDESESNIGNWVTDVMREAAGAEFAVTNSTALRTDLDAGPLTRGEIYSISPFPNVLATFRATGTQLLAFARKNARDALKKDKAIVQVSGISYAFDPRGEIYGLGVGGKPVELDRSYLGATTDYLIYSQPEKYLGFVPEERETTALSIFDLMCEAAARESPIAACVEGRMRALAAGPAGALPATPGSGGMPVRTGGTPTGAGGSPTKPRAETCEPAPGRHPNEPLPLLHTLDSAGLDRMLADLPQHLPRFEDRLWALALARLGAPYALGTLGEANADDPDPVFRVDEADCTVLVLTTAALAHARSVAEAERWMHPANYRRRGDSYPVTYQNRLHFTEDRLTSSPLFADITAEVARSEELKTVRVVLNRQKSGKELLPLDWERELTLSYVPALHLEAVLARAPELCGIALVRLANISKGFFVAHEGFLLDRHCLLHASSETGKVVLVDALDYVLRRDDPGRGSGSARGSDRSPRFDGAILYAFREGGIVLIDDSGRAPAGAVREP